MFWKIEVYPRDKRQEKEIISHFQQFINSKDFSLYKGKVYFLQSDACREDIENIASSLLVDALLEEHFIASDTSNLYQKSFFIIYRQGVFDPVGDILQKEAGHLGVKINQVRCGAVYKYQGISEKELREFSPRILYNPLIEEIIFSDEVEKIFSKNASFVLETKPEVSRIKLSCLSDKELEELSSQYQLSLELKELQLIRAYYQKLKREPTDCELHTFASLWSEHCWHKTFRGIIHYQEKDPSGEVLRSVRVDNLLKSTIMRATEEISHPGCVSVFSDNAGIVRFDEEDNLCFKVETHNHPCSLEPYGGSSTGLGGVIRDILGTGCCAYPFASCDVFCFSDWQLNYHQLPPGLLHPLRIIKGVVKGVRDYGNRMGIPTVAGAVFFDQRFLGNPLVYCGTLGIMPKKYSVKKVEPGQSIILIGAKTGCDGIGGATFSSQNLTSSTINLHSAVQIGSPIEEKKLTEGLIRARNKNLFSAITDCGAGGICTAITEITRGYGAQVYLDKVHLKETGLSPWQIWVSESQERMIILADEENIKELEEIFKEEEVELAVVGKVRSDNKLIVFYKDEVVVDLDNSFLFSPPQLEKKGVWIKKEFSDIKLPSKENYNNEVEKLLSSLNIASRDWIIREYDHEVGGGSVLKPIAGIGEIIKVNDAAVVKPKLSSKKAVALGMGINPFYSDFDPYLMAGLVIDEALRNVLSVGGNLKNTFILDNFSWASPEKEDVLGGLVRAALGCYDYSLYYGVPFISGKDSLYNEYTIAGREISIPGTLLISAISLLEDSERVISADFKKEGNLIYILGETSPELGASEFFRTLKKEGGVLPSVKKKWAKKALERLASLIEKGLIISCHDISEGGLAISLAEMCLGSNLGASIFLEEVPQDKNMLDYEILFSESPTRFIVEVEKEKKDIFQKETEDIPKGLVGCVGGRKMVVYGLNCQEIVSLDIVRIRKSYLSPFESFRYRP